MKKVSADLIREASEKISNQRKMLLHIKNQKKLAENIDIKIENGKKKRLVQEYL